MTQHTAAASTKKPCLEFSIGDIVDINMKEFCPRLITSRYFQIHTFHPTFIVPLNLLPPISHLIAEAPPPFHT